MMQQYSPPWVALAYLVPASPSKARVFVWRRLKALGAQNIRPGLALLPNSRESVSAFEQLSEKIVSFSGEALLFEMNFIEESKNREVQEQFAAAQELSIKAKLTECSALLEKLNSERDSSRRAQLNRTLQKKLKSVSPAVSKGPVEELENAFGGLLDILKQMPGEFSSLFRQSRQ